MAHSPSSSATIDGRGVLRSIDPGQVNYAVSDVDMQTGELLRWWVLSGIRGTRACAHLCDQLSTLVPALPQTVIVERQSRKSGLMTAIQCWTEAYYESRGVRVWPIPAKLKSTVLTEQVVTDYRSRKRAAVMVAASRMPAALQEQWRALKKKDDVADTHCQALAWLMSKKKLTL